MVHGSIFVLPNQKATHKNDCHYYYEIVTKTAATGVLTSCYMCVRSVMCGVLLRLAHAWVHTQRKVHCLMLLFEVVYGTLVRITKLTDSMTDL